MIKVMVDGNIQVWSLEDPTRNVDWVSDFVGNFSGFDNMEQMDHEEHGVVYVTDADNAAWWTDAIAMQQRIDNLSHELEQVMSRDELRSALEDTDHSDIEDQLKAQLDIIEKLAEEHNLI